MMKISRVIQVIILSLSVITLLFWITHFITPQKASANHGSRYSGCVIPLGTASYCCGADYCAGPDLVNDCEQCYVDNAGNESGCTVWQDPHTRNYPGCAPTPTPEPVCAPSGVCDPADGSIAPSCNDGSPIPGLDSNCGTPCYINVPVCPTGTPITPTPTPVAVAPSIEKLVITNAPEGLAGYFYGLTGLQAPQSGSDFYNPIDVRLRVNSNLSGITNVSNISIVGIAFTNKNSPPSSPTLNSLISSINAPDAGGRPNNGFILTYTQECPSTGCTVGSHTFTEGKYEIYYQGAWRGTLNVNDTLNLSSQGLDIIPRNFRTVSTNPAKVEVKFEVYFFPAIDEHTWGTYGYLVSENGTEMTSNLSPQQSSILLGQKLFNLPVSFMRFWQY